MWDKIKVRDLQRLIDVSKRECSDEVEVFDRDVELVSIIHSTATDEVDSWDSKKFKEVRVQLYELFASTNKIVQQPKITVNGITFYFRGGKNYQDIKELAKSEGINDTNFSERITHALAFFYQPSKLNSFASYNKYKTASARAELFLDAPASCVFALSNLIAASTPVLGKLVEKKATKAYNDLADQAEGLVLPE